MVDAIKISLLVGTLLNLIGYVEFFPLKVGLSYVVPFCVAIISRKMYIKKQTSLTLKHIILARPSSLIITDMKRLISKLGLDAKPLTHLNELHGFDSGAVGAIVISTALSSNIKEKYWEVVALSKKVFPGKPIILTSFATVKSTKITAGAHLKKASIDMNLISLDELGQSGFDPNEQILILTQKELADSALLPSITQLVEGLIHSSSSSGKSHRRI